MEGIDAEGPMCPDQAGGAPFQKIETRPPHYRPLGKNPKVVAAFLEIFVHRCRVRPLPLTGPRVTAWVVPRNHHWGQSSIRAQKRRNPQVLGQRWHAHDPSPRAYASAAISGRLSSSSRWSVAGAISGTTRPERRKSPSTAGGRAKPRPAESIPAAGNPLAAIRSESK